MKAHWTARAKAAGQKLAEYKVAGSKDMRKILCRITELVEEVEVLKA